MSMKYGDKIYIAGHKGMVGSALIRLLTKQGYDNILTVERGDIDLRCQQKVTEFFATHQPDDVFLAYRFPKR